MSIERIPSDFGSFSDVVAIDGPGRWVLIAGAVGMDSEGVVKGDMAAQTHKTLDNIEASLAKVGASLSDVVKITTFLTSLDEYAAFSAVREARFGDHSPASATVQVAGLLIGAEIEIEALAFVTE